MLSHQRKITTKEKEKEKEKQKAKRKRKKNQTNMVQLHKAFSDFT